MNSGDRFMNGFIAGIVAGIVLDILNFISHSFHITELSYWEWASVLIYGYRAESQFEVILALFLQIFFAGITGIIFAYLIASVTSKHHLSKGVIYSVFIWFSANAIVYMYEVSPLIPTKGDTVLSNLFTISAYGLVLAYMLKRQEEESKQR